MLRVLFVLMHSVPVGVVEKRRTRSPYTSVNDIDERRHLVPLCVLYMRHTDTAALSALSSGRQYCSLASAGFSKWGWPYSIQMWGPFFMRQFLQFSDDLLWLSLRNHYCVNNFINIS